MSELGKLPDLAVLIADPSIHMRRIIREILLRAGIKRIIDATDGADALQQYVTLVPDVVIIEWEMPLLSGEDFIKLVRNSPETQHRETPIILTLGQPQKTTVKRAMDLGILDILVKPLAPKTLAMRILTAVERVREIQRQRLKEIRSGQTVRMPNLGVASLT